MAKKLMIVESSPRLNGNSSTLAEQAGLGARQMGAEVEIVRLHRLDIRACDGCDFCKETGVCVLKDDMQALYPRVLAADALLLASPIYWFTFNAQLKLFIDRLYGLWNYQNHFLSGKPVGVILTYADANEDISGAVNAIHTFHSMFHFTGARIVGILHGSLGEIGDAARHPELMDRAFRLGGEMVSSS